MKRKFAAFSILICGLFSACLSASAENSNLYSCAAPYDMSGSFSSTMSRVTGANFAASKIAAGILKSQVTKDVDGKFKTSVDSFSVPDLKNGRFRGFQIHGTNVVSQGVHFSSMDIQTLCDFNYIVYNSETSSAVFKEDFPLSFAITLSEEDLNNTMKAAGYENLIRKMNNFGKSFSLFEIVSTTSRIKDNKFIYGFDVKVPLLSSSKYTFMLTSDLTVKNGHIVMANPELVNSYAKVDLRKLTKAFDYLNPFEYSLNVMENKNADLKVRNINIVNNKINISGIINIPKDVLTQHKD